MSEEKNINQDERFDELYRSSLAGMRVEPPARVWNRMSRLLLWKELLRLNFSNVPGYAWVIAAVIALVVGGGIWWLTSEDQPEEPAQVSSISVAPAPEPGVTVARTNTASSPPEKTAVAASAMEPVARPSAAAVYTASSVKPAAVIQPETEAQPVSKPVLVLVPMESMDFGTFGAVPSVDPVRFTSISNPVPDIHLPPDIQPAGKRIPNALNLGLSLTPDIVFYNNSSSYFKYDYSLDAGVQYDLGRFYVLSGLGVSWSSDIGNYAVSANKQDSIGYYYSVVSISEVPGEPGQIQYNTMMSTVYDTVQYVYDYSTRNSYTYLTIPLSIGFRAVVKPLWSFSVDAGGFWSGLISSKEPEPSFYIPDGRITSVENTTPVRNKNSYGLMGSLRFEYLFAKHFTVMIAPTFKYHLNAIDDREIPGSTQPWSVGFRAGIWYRIDLTK